MSQLFKTNDIVSIKLKEFVELEYGMDLDKELYFQTKKADDYTRDGGLFQVTKIFTGGVFESGEKWQTLMLKPLSEDFEPTDFLHEETVLDTVDTMEIAKEKGFLLMDNYTLELEKAK